MTKIDNGGELVEMAQELWDAERDEVIIKYVQQKIDDIAQNERIIQISVAAIARLEREIAEIENGDASKALEYTRFQRGVACD